MTFRNKLLTVPGLIVAAVLLGPLGLLGATAAQAATPTPPFAECPAIGLDSSCGLLIDLTNSGATVLQDTTQGTFDGQDDTLIGIVNNSTVPVSSLPVASSTEDIMGFDGDGACDNPNSTSGIALSAAVAAACAQNTVDTTTYGGPDAYFTGYSASNDYMSGIVNFITPLAPGASTWFSLEEALSAASFVVPGTIVLTPPSATTGVGANDTVTATVDNSTGAPVSGTTVTFDITSGPNAGKTATAATNASGVATFTYSSSLAGTDTVSASFNDPASGLTINSNSVTVAWINPILTGRAYGLSAKATLLGAPLLTIMPTPDTGPISTSSSSSTATPCAKTLSGPLVSAQALCANVTTVSYPGKSVATASVANADLGIPGVPAIALQTVASSSTTTCSGSSGSTTIAFLQIGSTVVISRPTTIAPNTTISVGVVKLVLNQQIPITSPDKGLTVNAINLSVNTLGVQASVIVAASESDVDNCS
jgi:Big-like domain-containing protein